MVDASFQLVDFRYGWLMLLSQDFLVRIVGKHGVETQEEHVRPFDICTLRSSTVLNRDGLDIFFKWRSKRLMTETRLKGPAEDRVQLFSCSFYIMHSPLDMRWDHFCKIFGPCSSSSQALVM